MTHYLLAFLRVADEARSQNNLDSFPSYSNYFIQNEEIALALFSVDRATSFAEV
jgi:hypothetical protein